MNPIVLSYIRGDMLIATFFNLMKCFVIVGMMRTFFGMLTVVTFDRFGVIRDYLYDRDENGEYFFGISKGNKLEVYLLTSAKDLYEYLAEESEGFRLIARKELQTN